ncbi:MAG: M23 family metallopeptidase [Rhodospirillales bacterium]|nr:M23 family metallopeptidase [Rhodospirillales bacterium]
MTPYPDRPLFEGIQRFQNDNGLAVDGVMEPGGETEHAMRNLVSGSTDAGIPMPDGFSLSGRVGNGLENPPGDVLKSKQALGALKYYPGHLAADPTNIIDRPLTQAIYKFQKDHGLQQDGWMRPDGETEAKIREKVKTAKSENFEYRVADDIPNPELAQRKEPTKKSETPKPTSDPGQTVSPIDTFKIRKSGRFEANREKNPLGLHEGVDLDAAPGTPIQSPVNGTIEMIGDPYKHRTDPNDKTKPHPHAGKFESVWIKTEDGRRFGFLYVAPEDPHGNRLFSAGDKVRAGDPIGAVQNWKAVDPRIVNHTHFEVRQGPGRGTPVDPEPWLKQWSVRD